MFRFFSMVLFFLASFIVSITSEIKPLNDKTTTEIMNKLPVILIPSTFVFFVYIIIFIFLAIWLWGFWRTRFDQPKELLLARSLLFNASLGLHILCVYLLHYEFFTLTVIALIGLLGTSALLYFSYGKTENNLLSRLPISLYLGWNIFLLTFLGNYTLILTEWTGWGISQALWSVIFLTVLTAIGLHFLYHYHDFAFNSVLIWGFLHIALKNGFDFLFVTTAALFLTAVIVACHFIFKSRRNVEKVS